jgi:hypothetical protein
MDVCRPASVTPRPACLLMLDTPTMPSHSDCSSFLLCDQISHPQSPIKSIRRLVLPPPDAPPACHHTPPSSSDCSHCLVAPPTGPSILEAAAASAQSAASAAGPHSKKKRRVDAAADDAAAGSANNAAAAGAYGLEVARTLQGHLHCVAAVAWPAQGVVFTGGWDHSVRR